MNNIYSEDRKADRRKEEVMGMANSYRSDLEGAGACKSPQVAPHAETVLRKLQKRLGDVLGNMEMVHVSLEGIANRAFGEQPLATAPAPIDVGEAYEGDVGAVFRQVYDISHRLELIRGEVNRLYEIV